MTFNGRMITGVTTFVAVADAGSFRAAARSLDITPSGVSRAIHRLEERLGVRLFNRSPRSVTLTDEGQRFHEEVAPLLSGISAAAETLQDNVVRVSGRLRIQACPPMAHYVLAPKIGRFLSRHPDLTVEIDVRDRLGDLAGDHYDLALRFGEPEPSAMVVRKLADTAVLTCASPSYLERFGTPRTPQDLLDGAHRCIDFRMPNSARIAEWDFSIDGKWKTLPIKGRLVVNDAPSLLAACIGGYGIAQPLGMYCFEALRSGQLVRVLSEWGDERYPLHAYLPSDRHPSAKVRFFLEFIEGMIASCEHAGDRSLAA